MALINTNLGNRRYLNPAEKDFLIKTISLAKTISEWIEQKAVFIKLKNFNKIDPSVILADILIESQWGIHPLAQTHYNKRYSNNLAMLQIDELWQGKTQKYEGKDYKAYQDWLHFATDYSDIMIFCPKYKQILKSNNPISVLAADKDEPLMYAVKSQSLIEYYQLTKI